MTDHRETPNTYISRIGGGKYLDPKADLTEAPTELLDNELTSKALGIVEKSAMSEAQLYAYEQFWRAVIDEQALIDGGYTKGRTEGEAIGRAEGEQARAIETARKMKGDGMPSELIVKYTGLSVDIVNGL